MKRVLVLVLAIMTVVTLIPFSVAAESSKLQYPNAEITYLRDGSYLVTVILEDDTMQPMAAATTKVLKKATAYYNSSNVIMCSLTLEATFSINIGSSVSCTSVTYETRSFDSAWSVENVTTSKNNSSTSQASGSASGKFIKRWLGIKINTVNFTTTITCDKNGNYW